MYVSITGLELKRAAYAPAFWVMAIAALRQATADPNCLKADARTIRGVHHTRSLWTSEAAMRAFLVAGAHGAALRRFDRIATGKTLGFEADALPDWEEVHRLWHAEGRTYAAPDAAGRAPS